MRKIHEVHESLWKVLLKGMWNHKIRVIIAIVLAIASTFINPFVSMPFRIASTILFFLAPWATIKAVLLVIPVLIVLNIDTSGLIERIPNNFVILIAFIIAVHIVHKAYRRKLDPDFETPAEKEARRQKYETIGKVGMAMALEEQAKGQAYAQAQAQAHAQARKDEYEKAEERYRNYGEDSARVSNGENPIHFPKSYFTPPSK